MTDPKGWIGEAFTLFEEDVDENFAKVHQELSQMNRKIDIILQHITGISQSSDSDPDS